MALLLVLRGAGADRVEPDARVDLAEPDPLEAFSGGTATNVKQLGPEAFSQPATSMTFDRRRDFFLGNGLFSRVWVAAPDADQSADGLGPLYNARSCRRCHVRDARGHPPQSAEDDAITMVLKLSIAPRNDSERRRLAERRALVIPEPTYGEQLQDFALDGQRAEGRLVVEYEETAVALADGSIVRLRKPRYRVGEPAYGAMQPRTLLGGRIAPAMIGLGLLEAIDPEHIMARADADDDDGDGISGRPNRVWSAHRQRIMLGRFGWKATTATIADQSAVALSMDVGISSPLAPAPWGDCTEAQRACRSAPHGGDMQSPEASGETMAKIVFYSRHLAVPRRRNVGDPDVLRGKALFYASGCHGCHTPKHVTRGDWPLPALAGQLIWPYTDLLLHDMGEGLSDERPEGEASGREWRTAPLWGIGLTETVSGHTYFLHDGRARDLLEAILWHGGEAQVSRDAVRNMSATDREALLDFLNSL